MFWQRACVELALTVRSLTPTTVEVTLSAWPAKRSTLTVPDNSSSILNSTSATLICTTAVLILTVKCFIWGIKQNPDHSLIDFGNSSCQCDNYSGKLLHHKNILPDLIKGLPTCKNKTKLKLACMRFCFTQCGASLKLPKTV